MTTMLTTADAPMTLIRRAVSRHWLIWALQVLLAVAFLAHGLMVLFPPAEIVEQMNASLPRWFQLFIGVTETLAAIGLILPGLTGIQPGLVAWAAAGIMVVMVSATIYHLARHEVSSAITTLILLGMATVVARARHQPRQS